MFKSLAIWLASALTVSAAGALNYTDDNTGISFSGYFDGEGYTIGLAMPENPSTDLIAQIVSPLKDGEGWGGFDFGVSMAGYLLIVAWPNGDDVVLSPRMATGYTTPSAYTGNVTLTPIADGTFINSTHLSATFLCAGCITGNSDSFSANETNAVFAYAYSTTAVTDPTDSSTELSYHTAGYSAFGMTLAYAKSADYDTWAAMAKTTTTTPSGNTTIPSNSTTPGSTATPSPTSQPTTISNVTYDYIIGGGGAAGLVVAGRLAETGASVLLLERGGPSTVATGSDEAVSWNSSITPYDIPAMDYYLASSGVSSPYCTDTASMAGCVLGGGGAVNAMMYVKPQDVDFNDKWPAGWKADDVRKASDRFFSRNPGSDMPSADHKRYDQGTYNLLSSFLGKDGFSPVKPLEEPNRKVDVFAHPPWLVENGLRGGPVKTYLPQVQGLSNFKLSMNTNVIRAVRNGTWVSGVEVEKQDGTHEIIRVTPNSGKVILAAGTMSTPRILFYSGIGPADQLKAVPSTVKMLSPSQWIDLPVGEGVKDHPIITVTLGTKNNGTLTALDETAFTAPDNTSISMFDRGSGLLTQSGQRLNFWTSVVSPSDGKTRFLQGTCNSPSSNMVRIKLYVTHGLTSSSNLVLDSTGELTQFTHDPWLQTQGDIEAYEGFLARLIAMAGRPDSTLTLQLADGTDAPAGINATALLADLRSTLTPGDHFVGTAKMGPDDRRRGNGTAVVDDDTRVYGTDNLFVVDASIHPDLPTGNTQAIVMVAAERAVERILALDGMAVGQPAAGNRTGAGKAPGVGAKRVPFRQCRGCARGLAGRRHALKDLHDA
ncbi:Uu.00g067760.m01.CDS01 [Anthostomella pinea]|uniref:Uu.00g067760.m01.CDS01 n=1 Tax=Anthostomella pinea TaxID=933095 RepID=A0AAI8YNI7_9PEZI|nr:Uu.00g067760.m01.CDS01 [Anthostomella pinea]